MQFCSAFNATLIVHYDGITGDIEDLLTGVVQLIEH